MAYPGAEVPLLEGTTVRWKAERHPFFSPVLRLFKGTTETLQNILGTQTMRQGSCRKFSEKVNLGCRDSTGINLGKVWHV